MLTGFHYLPGGEDAPFAPMAASTFLDIAPTMGMRSPERLCRLFFKGRIDPTVIAEQASVWHRYGCRVVLGNEPNLSSEGFGGGPEDYAAWFSSVKAKIPGVRCYWAGMSPSGNWREWYDGAGTADGIAAHAYGTAAQMREVVDYLASEYPAKPIWLSEVNFGAGQEVARDRWADEHLRPFLDWCSTVPQVEAVTYFAYVWKSPDLALPTPVDAKGTRIETVLRTWRAPAATPAPTEPPRTTPGERKPMDPSENPWRGKILTVWNLPTSPAALVGVGRDLALDGFEVKTADGDSSWLGRRRLTKTYVDALKSEGFRVMGWSYNYCDGLVRAGDRGDGVPAGEAAAARRGVEELGLDGHTFDLEIECEGNPTNTAILLDLARVNLPVPIAAHTWADLGGHARYPAREIAQRVDVLRPMVYRPVWNAAACWRSWGALYDGAVVCPVWGITEGTAIDLREDMAYADEQKVPGEAYWEYAAVAGLSSTVRTLIAGRSFGASLDPDAITHALDGIWAATEHLAAIEHADIAREIQTRIHDLKVALGRET